MQLPREDPVVAARYAAASARGSEMRMTPPAISRLYINSPCATTTEWVKVDRVPVVRIRPEKRTRIWSAMIPHAMTCIRTKNPG